VTEPHAWETRQMEKAQEAAAETVGRLERALAEMESELDFRREELGQIIADRHDRGARLFDASQRGGRMVFGGSMAPNTAERAWDDAPADAVRTVADHIVQQPRWDAEEGAALNAVGSLEQRVSLAQRALKHWRAVAGTDAPSSDSGPVDCAPTVPPTEPEAAKAEAAEGVEPCAHAAPSSPPASSSVSIRGRLAGLADRVAGW